MYFNKMETSVHLNDKHLLDDKAKNERTLEVQRCLEVSI